MPSNTAQDNLKIWAKEEGFELLAIAPAQLNERAEIGLNHAIDQNWHGSMAWLKETATRRANPSNLWPRARSVIMLAMNYGPEHNPLDQLEKTDEGIISVYARHRDYHDVIKGKLKQIAGRLASKFKCEVKVFVDTAPVMEKPLAQQAGLGWQGKHTNLVSKNYGSWLFLASIFTDLEMEANSQEKDHCGSCSACLDICPTSAFPAPYQLDARKCISYLTIENKGPIPTQYRKLIGNRIYGCDDCLAVCPWNKFASTAKEAKLKARDDLKAPKLVELAQLDDGDFRQLFAGSPVKRIGRDRFLRNVLTALGNSNIENAVEVVKSHLKDPNSLVRGAAIWALNQLLSEEQFQQLRETYIQTETNSYVKDEWQSRDITVQSLGEGIL